MWSVLVENRNVSKSKTLVDMSEDMPEIHLRQPRFTYTPCRPFRKRKEGGKKLKKNENTII